MSGQAQEQAAGQGPLVSVVVPTYNYGRFIGDMLESVLAQTYARWECVVVDDGSTDDTAAVVAAYAARDARIKYLWQRNQFQAAARNLGLRHTTGQYVQFLDADDLIEPRKFERQVACLEARPEVGIVYGGVRFFPGENTRERLHAPWGGAESWMPAVSGPGREVLGHLLRFCIMVVNAPLVRCSVVEAVGPFDEGLTPTEDWDFWLRCALGGVRFLHDDAEGTLALVRFHTTSSTRNRVRMYEAILRTRRKFAGLTDDAELLALNREMTAWDEARLAVEEAAAGRLLGGLGRVARAPALEPAARWRAKWLLFTLAARFVSQARLTALMTASPRRAALGPRRKTGAKQM